MAEVSRCSESHDKQNAPEHIPPTISIPETRKTEQQTNYAQRRCGIKDPRRYLPLKDRVKSIYGVSENKVPAAALGML